jgi:hypothetical protein
MIDIFADRRAGDRQERRHKTDRENDVTMISNIESDHFRPPFIRPVHRRPARLPDMLDPLEAFPGIGVPNQLR